MAEVENSKDLIMGQKQSITDQISKYRNVQLYNSNEFLDYDHIKHLNSWGNKYRFMGLTAGKSEALLYAPDKLLQEYHKNVRNAKESYYLKECYKQANDESEKITNAWIEEHLNNPVLYSSLSSLMKKVGEDYNPRFDGYTPEFGYKLSYRYEVIEKLREDYEPALDDFHEKLEEDAFLLLRKMFLIFQDLEKNLWNRIDLICPFDSGTRSARTRARHPGDNRAREALINSCRDTLIAISTGRDFAYFMFYKCIRGYRLTDDEKQIFDDLNQEYFKGVKLLKKLRRRLSAKQKSIVKYIVIVLAWLIFCWYKFS